MLSSSSKPLFYTLNLIIFLLENSAFATHRDEFSDLTKQPYFVDKSLLLEKYFAKESELKAADNQKKDVANLNYYFINCPRGFGKTTNLKMIQSFAGFEPGVNFTMKPYQETKAHDVFKNLKIYDLGKTVYKHMNQYGVIYLDLDFDPDDLVNETMAEKSFVAKLSQSFKSYPWLSDLTIRPSQRAMRILQNIITGKVGSTEISRGLYYMARLLDKYNPKAFILLVDNFDSAARASVQRPNLAVKFLYNLIFRTVDKMLSINFPSATDFQKRCICLITGITKLRFESMDFKSHGYFRSVPFLSYGFFSPFFGFTQEDVDGLLRVYKGSEYEKKGVATFYKGYTFDTNEFFLYNPIDIIEYFKSKETFGVGKYDPYWAANESIDFIVEFARAPLFRAKLKDLCTLNSFKVASPFKNIDLSMFVSFLESSGRNYEEMLDEDVPALLHYFYEHGFLKHASKLVWRSFVFANFEVKNEVKRKLEERGVKFEN